MNTRPTIDEAFLIQTRIAQAQASDPLASAWVTANAGSGKTHVLVQRVVRLLLNGVLPSRILCLTFTKAAAANMAGRVFKMLADWTSLDDAELAEAIEAMGAGESDAARLAFARKLFARTIETPGGLKIQTIHAFCERLLHLFPFEAEVAAGFRVAEAPDQARLLERAQLDVLACSLREAESAADLAILAREAGEGGFDGLLREALKLRGEIARGVEAHGGVAGYGAALARRMGLAPGEDAAGIEAAMLAGLGGRARWPEFAARLMQGSKNDQDRAGDLQRACAAADPASALAGYLAVFFTKEGAPRGVGAKTIITKPLAQRDPSLLAAMETERDRLIGLRDKLKAAATLERSAALIGIAHAILDAYQRLKRERGVLDFDDLIERALALLQGPGAAWVLYKLDYGIDHILVDEAQDTSVEQWEILTQLAADFTTGASARGGARTFFAVGDEKQSIYSFQGAAPEMFDAKRRELAKKHAEAELGFLPVSLNLSFRSAASVLSGVDHIYSVTETRRGLAAGDEAPPSHTAFHRALPGLIEMWEPIAGETEKPREDWRMPLDAASAADPAVALARRVAGAIKGWLAPGAPERVFGRGGKIARPIAAGDIMILVRKRGAFFEAMIRSLKEAGVRAAGTDRLKLREHIAVMDLIAAGRAVLTPDDDLALASLLKSPLIGLDDDDLMALAPGRPASLRQALAEAGAPRFVEARARLATWRERAASATPFAFYARLLGEDGGRRALLSRLGDEAREAIDEFLSAALAFEQKNPPSLARFLAEVESAESEVKRDMESQGDSVRVMTIHAAKGLEASVVILPDTCFAVDAHRDAKLFELADRHAREPLIAWSPRGDADPAEVARARAGAAEAAAGEHRRLLYVAMTRAAERLVIAGYHGPRGRGRDCWYDMARAGLESELSAAPAPWDSAENIWRMGTGATGETRAGAPEAPPAPGAAPWLARRAAPEAAPQALRPSGAGAANIGAAPAERERRLEAGRLAHALLQYLPDIAAEHRVSAARRFLDARAPGFSSDERERALSQALGVLDHPRLRALFGPNARAEVAIAAQGAAGAFAGRIDRILAEEECVTIADFKSGSGGSSRQRAAYAAQIRLYRTALQPIYKGRTIRCLLIWLDGPQITEIK